MNYLLFYPSIEATAYYILGVILNFFTLGFKRKQLEPFFRYKEDKVLWNILLYTLQPNDKVWYFNGPTALRIKYKVNTLTNVGLYHNHIPGLLLRINFEQKTLYMKYEDETVYNIYPYDEYHCNSELCKEVFKRFEAYYNKLSKELLHENNIDLLKD